MELLFVGLIAGSIIGTLITRFLLDRNSAYGTFSVEPGNDPEDPEVTNLRVRIFNDQDLYNKKQIVLYKDSHK